ncbi:NAD-dependent succinate-semialdehyde dehydrogenase [Leucobacter insecticola]|uniref:NAD-dependent succinate-semialdehyde dehydrogenase n=1 Tax=Leucobacter insecticola TaxID=2714934 RepID=A0A6G8FIA6_9MICO|nr:NAD-dependent succinate-semialdehyde dehydrogenase [Leucobacter insecticola]QIM16180.1 NAD-dependent succinate-semialdehyde dehydrogenase [Leucobacter insecticola]
MNALPEKTPTGLFIGGEWCDAECGATLAVTNPATGGVLAHVASASVADGKTALDAAVAAQKSWAATAPRERGEILRRAFELTIQHREELARIITLEMGKPLAESRGEVNYGAEFLRWFSEEAVRIDGRYSMSPDGGNRLLVLHRPVGPSLFITPWNFPLAMATRKIAPALAAGCTSVLKPAAQTPLTALYFAALLVQAGVPAGVVNVIPTATAGAVISPLTTDPRLRKISFTGSTEVGKRLIRDSAEQVLKVSMELGGNAPFIVFEDADIDAAVEGALVAKLRNGGEACVAANRFLVHESVAEEFTSKLAARMAGYVQGPGMADGVTIGPLIDEATRNKVSSLVASAVAEGATVKIGGEIPAGDGFFYPPTVLTSVPHGAEILNEEIFGPVAPIVVFADETEAIELANASEYGLVSFVYTQDLNRSLRLAEQLESGMIGVNTGLVSNPAAPFGGIKQSGLGREGGAEGIHEFLETVYVGISNPLASQ